MTNKIKVLEIGAEGGSITMYQVFDAKNKDWYIFSVNDMGLDDEVPGVIKDSNYSMSYVEAFFRMLKAYPHLLELYPLYVHTDFAYSTMVIIKELTINKDYINYTEWAKVLEVTEVDLK
jgi:hypothetical protein